MLVDYQFVSNFYLHWFFSNLSFFERDPHLDSPEAIRVKKEPVEPVNCNVQYESPRRDQE